ncbi:MAG TPA: lipase maturation factor family protein [Terracidiphilus sp.]|nr:lipase maturation factor family protein [Terracidiphilus sp.]
MAEQAMTERSPADARPPEIRGRFGADPIRWLFGSGSTRSKVPRQHGQPEATQWGLGDRLIPRWLFLRALALIYFSAFYSLLFQIKGLIGPQGILPAHEYLAAVAEELGRLRFWFAPSLYWISTGNGMMMTVTWIGLIASVAAFFNIWPRLSFFLCFVCFLSFVGASSVFSEYQSDGMLLEAGFIALFFAPPGIGPGWGAAHPPSRMSLWLLQWEWFRIYFESGLVKLLSGDIEWRNFTAMDEYYQNGPLPTWIGWYAEHLPHGFHAFTVAATLTLELGLVFMLFFPRRVRIACFFIVTPWEIAVILTANYAFLNYLVLSLGILLLDDKFLRPLVPARLRPPAPEALTEAQSADELPLSILAAGYADTAGADPGPSEENRGMPDPDQLPAKESGTAKARRALRSFRHTLGLAASAFLLSWVGYVTTIQLIGLPLGHVPGPALPVSLLSPFRIANQYGLFAVMTRGRYEIEFQGSNDGRNWTPYLFRNKPQALNQPPGVYAPYQPRFDWNLWFASLGDWRQNEFVPLTEERLLENDKDVLALFKGNPFPDSPPRYVRAVLWQYWFTSRQEKRSTGNWWRRQYLGLYAPELSATPDGKFEAVQMPGELPPHD